MKWAVGTAFLSAVLAVSPGLLAGILGPRLLAERIERRFGARVLVEGVSGGWFESVSATGVTLRMADEGGDDREPLLEADRIQTDLALPALLAGDEALHIVAEGLVLRIRRGASSGLEGARAIAGPETGPGSLPQGSSDAGGRRIEIEVPDGVVVLEPGGERFRLEVSVSIPPEPAEALRGRIVLAGETGAEAEAEVALARAPDGSPEGSLRVSARDLDLAPWAALAGPASGARPRGRLRHLLATIEGRPGGALDIVAQAEAETLSLGTAEEPAEPLAWCHLHASGRVDGRKLTRGRIGLTSSEGGLDLGPDAEIDLSGDAVAGRAKFRCALPHVSGARALLGRVLPPGLEVDGALAADGDAEGSIDLAPGVPLARRLEALALSAKLEVAAARAGGVAVRDASAAFGVAAGKVRVDRLVAGVGGGRVTIEGTLPLDPEAAGAELAWRIEDGITIHHQPEGGVEVIARLGGAGRLGRVPGGWSMEGSGDSESLAITPPGGAPALLGRAEWRVSAEAGDDPGAFRILEGSYVAPEATVAVRGGRLDLAPPGALAANVLVSCEPAVLARLAPDLPRLEGTLAFDGSIDVPFAGDVAALVKARGFVRAGAVTVDGRRFTGVTARFLKDGPVITADHAAAGFLGGRIEASGTAHLDGLAPGDRLDFRGADLALDETWGGVASGPGLRLGAVAGGTARVERDAGGYRLEADLVLGAPSLRRGGETIASLPELKAAGRARIVAGRVRELSGVTLRGGALAVDVAAVRLPAVPGEGGPFELEGRADADGAWITALAATALPAGVEFGGRTRISAKVSGDASDPWATVNGTIEARSDAVRAGGEDFTELQVDAVAGAGRLAIRQGRVRLRGGWIRAAGEVAFLDRARRPEDKLIVEAGEVPVEIREPIDGFRGFAPAEVLTKATAGGSVELGADPGGGLRVRARVDCGTVTRLVAAGGGVAWTAALPAVSVQAEGTIEEGGKRMRWPALFASGEGCRVDVRDLRRDGAEWSAASADVSWSRPWLEALLVGRGEETVRPEGSLTAHAEGRLAGGAGGWPGRLSARVRFDAEAARCAGLDAREVSGGLRLDGGSLTIDRLGGALSGGRFRVEPGSRVDLAGGVHRFSGKVFLEDVRLEGPPRPELAIVSPIFLADPSRGDVEVSGRVDGELALRGGCDGRPGWSRAVDGEGRFRLREGRVVGSTLLLELATKAPLALNNTVHNAVTSITGKGGSPGEVVGGLARRGIAFETIESPIRVKAGRVALADGLKVAAPEIVMTVDGTGSLEGDVDYRVETDLIARVRLKSVTDLPGEIPLIGGLIDKVNPFKLLDAVELGARVSGNALRRRPDGSPDVQVEVTTTR